MQEFKIDCDNSLFLSVYIVVYLNSPTILKLEIKKSYIQTYKLKSHYVLHKFEKKKCFNFKYACMQSDVDLLKTY